MPLHGTTLKGVRAFVRSRCFLSLVTHGQDGSKDGCVSPAPADPAGRPGLLAVCVGRLPPPPSPRGEGSGRPENTPPLLNPTPGSQTLRPVPRPPCPGLAETGQHTVLRGHPVSPGAVTSANCKGHGSEARAHGPDMVTTLRVVPELGRTLQPHGRPCRRDDRGRTQASVRGTAPGGSRGAAETEHLPGDQSPTDCHQHAPRSKTFPPFLEKVCSILCVVSSFAIF